MKYNLYFKCCDTGFFYELKFNSIAPPLIPRIGDYVNMDCGFYVHNVEYTYKEAEIDICIKLTAKIIIAYYTKN